MITAVARRRTGLWLLEQLLAVLVLSIVALSVYAQGSSWGLGEKYELLAGDPDSGPLQKHMGRGSLGRYDFVGKVGGVAFQQVAVPASSLRGKSIRLMYRPGLLDGERLRVMIGGKEYPADAPDWILIPVAKYANSKYNAVVSLFGPKTSASVYDIVYHSAFKNTLLGLRLLQVDILLFDLGAMWHLPTWQGEMVIGSGETAPTELNQAAARSIARALENAKFQSWVFTDEDEPVSFDIVDERLVLTGWPYYYFWVADLDGYNQVWETSVKAADEARATGDVTSYNTIVSKLNALQPTVSEVDSITRALRSDLQAIKDFNPAVYSAAQKTMQLSALFRYVKAKDKAGWNAFLKEVSKRSFGPPVTTPTRWPRGQ
jgi:hypothetical protein